MRKTYFTHALDGNSAVQIGKDREGRVLVTVVDKEINEYRIEPAAEDDTGEVECAGPVVLKKKIDGVWREVR